jgi:hypothetical protein
MKMKNHHPGFKRVASRIARTQGISSKRASAILAASSRKASAKAKRKNPRLKKVRMAKRKESIRFTKKIYVYSYKNART